MSLRGGVKRRRSNPLLQEETPSPSGIASGYRPRNDIADNEGNRKLIRLYEAKVKKVIPLRGRCEKVWEG
jgi:hypothetical protein